MADNVIYIDIEAGLKRVMNNAKLYAKLLLKFKDDPSFNEFDTVLTAGDMENAQIFNHKLKGLAANLSLLELYKQCLQIEEQIKAGSVNPDQITIAKNVYAQTLEKADEVIAQYA